MLPYSTQTDYVTYLLAAATRPYALLVFSRIDHILPLTILNHTSFNALVYTYKCF